ncbi:MAG TPA: hypothetical protein VGJ84_17645 [Polyangiaceae bacterium]
MAPEDSTTLYLRGIPRKVLRETKAAAAREGVTLSRWVSDLLARSIGTETGRWPRPAADARVGELEDAKAWYESRKVQLERKYGAQYIAILGRRVLDHDTDFDRLARRVFAKIGLRPVYMPRVGEWEIRIRSPRRARP